MEETVEVVDMVVVAMEEIVEVAMEETVEVVDMVVVDTEVEVADTEVGATEVPGSLPMMAFDNCSKAFVYFYTFLIISNSQNCNQTVLRNSFCTLYMSSSAFNSNATQAILIFRKK